MPPELMQMLGGGGQQPQGPQGPEPRDFGGLQLTPELITMILELLSSIPQAMGTDPSAANPSGFLPSGVQQASPQEMELQQLMSMVSDPAAQQANGAMGALGGAFGSMGGRPRGY